MSKKDKNKVKQKSGFFSVIYFLLAWIVGLIFRIKVVDRQNEPDEGGFVVCANHISATDPIMICYAFKKHQIRYMAKKELFKIPILRGFFRSLGAFPVDRGGNDVGAIKTAIKEVSEGRCVGIFPQGHRYPGEDPRATKTKNGAALIATKAEADIVPAYIWRKNRAGGIFRRTYVIIGEKIDFVSLGYQPEENGEYSRITDVIFDKVCALGEEFSPEKYKRAKKAAKKAKKAKKASK